MNNSAKAVLWMGFFMIAFGIVKNWSAISSTIFGSNSPALRVPGPGGIPPSPGSGNKKGNAKCPGPNYYYFAGKCYPSSVNLPPQNGPVLT